MLLLLGVAELGAREEVLPGLDFGGLKPREVRVYLPPGGVTPATPVLVAFDGQNMTGWRLDEALAGLAAKGLAVPLVVAIPAGDDRLEEYGMAGTPDYAGRGRKAADFQRFVVEVVLPAARVRYGVTADPARTGIMGASLGGLAAFDLAWRQPRVFGFAGVFSGSFWWRGDNSSPAAQQSSRLAHRLVRETPQPPRLRLWFEAGTKDEDSDRDGNGVIDAIQDTTELIDELARRGFKRGTDMRYIEMAGGQHNEATWARALPEFLEWVAGGPAGELAAAPSHPASVVSRADSTPRKVVIGSALAHFSGPLADRLALAVNLIDQAAHEAEQKYPGRRLDLMVFPEFALARGNGALAAEQAVRLEGPVLDVLGAKARELHTWIVIPLTLREEGAEERFSNAAVLLDRTGGVAGIFRKVHPIVDDHGVFEGGVTPGGSYPVFDCDFGRLGILICWDMSYEEAWDALGAGGAEIVAVPSASPQTLRPMAEALRHHYYVVSSTPKDNASVFDPIGRTAAQVTSPGVLVHEIDLAYAVLHWSEQLHEGRALTERFGAKAGYTYSTREDTGVFWSNDPQVSIGAMIRELGLREMSETIERVEAARKKQAK